MSFINNVNYAAKHFYPDWKLIPSAESNSAWNLVCQELKIEEPKVKEAILTSETIVVPNVVSATIQSETAKIDNISNVPNVINIDHAAAEQIANDLNNLEVVYIGEFGFVVINKAVTFAESITNLVPIVNSSDELTYDKYNLSNAPISKSIYHDIVIEYIPAPIYGECIRYNNQSETSVVDKDKLTGLVSQISDDYNNHQLYQMLQNEMIGLIINVIFTCKNWIDYYNEQLTYEFLKQEAIKEQERLDLIKSDEEFALRLALEDVPITDYSEQTHRNDPIKEEEDVLRFLLNDVSLIHVF